MSPPHSYSMCYISPYLVRLIFRLALRCASCHSFAHLHTTSRRLASFASSHSASLVIPYDDDPKRKPLTMSSGPWKFRRYKYSIYRTISLPYYVSVPLFCFRCFTSSFMHILLFSLVPRSRNYPFHSRLLTSELCPCARPVLTYLRLSSINTHVNILKYKFAVSP